MSRKKKKLWFLSSSYEVKKSGVDRELIKGSIFGWPEPGGAWLVDLPWQEAEEERDRDRERERGRLN